MNINSTTSKQSFQAKFLKTKTLEELADYAVSNNKFQKLNDARKKIEAHDYFVKIAVDYNAKNKFEFSTYTPQYAKSGNEIIKDFKIKKTEIDSKKQNYLKELYEIIIKMSNSAPENKLYKKIIKN